MHDYVGGSGVLHVELVRCREPGPLLPWEGEWPKFHPIMLLRAWRAWTLVHTHSPAQKGAPVSVGVVAGSLGKAGPPLRGKPWATCWGVLLATVVTAGGHSSALVRLPCSPNSRHCRRPKDPFQGCVGCCVCRNFQLLSPPAAPAQSWTQEPRDVGASEWPLHWPGSGAPGTTKHIQSLSLGWPGVSLQ